jgi:hypothetical protein
VVAVVEPLPHRHRLFMHVTSHGEAEAALEQVNAGRGEQAGERSGLKLLVPSVHEQSLNVGE